MKPEKIVTFFVGFLMACLLSFGAMGAMISGLQLPVENMDRLYLAWAVSALAGCILFSFKHGWIPALLGSGVGLGYLWQYHYLSLPIRALITRLSFIYNSAYSWGILEFAGVDWRAVSLDLPLGAFGCLIALAAAGYTLQGRGLSLTIGLALLPAASTVVVTNTPPASVFLYALLLGILLLLLTSTVRRHCPHQGAKLTAMTALPVALLLALLFRAYPQDAYVNRSQEYLDDVVGWWQSHIAAAWDTTGLLGQSSGGTYQNTTTNLSLIGPRANWRYAVMDVTSANESGTFYLRGQDYDVYDGANWTASPDREEYFYASWDKGNTITISTRRNANVLYLPYYTAGLQVLSGGRAANDGGPTEYSFKQADLPPNWQWQAHNQPIAGSNADVSEVYLELPEATLTWAADYLDRHLSDALDGDWIPSDGSRDEYFRSTLSNTEAAELIADFVRSSAWYDTDTPRMDRDYDDFAQWFLEESETGYCVHFATAAAVLLRAAGIPARYVTGYMFQAEAGEPTTVRADQAHAWVEYYEPLVNNWVVLEATPPDLGETETEPTEATEATEATEETEPPTEATTVPPTEAESQPRPADPTRPGQQEGPKIDLNRLWNALKWLLAPLGLWLLVTAQYRLRRILRRPRGGPNARALAKWQDAELLCRVTKQTPPEELEQLAQKAKFSQHTLTPEELRTFDAWLKAERDKLKKAPLYKQFLCKYVLALW